MPESLILPVHGTKQGSGRELFEGNRPEPEGEEGCRMTLLETLALLTFILTLLGLIVDVIRLTVEVMAKNFAEERR